MDYLFDKWEKIHEKFKNKHLLIFLDFDGTLAPIAETPAKAMLPQKTKVLLRQLSKNPKVKLAFISGRTAKDVKNKIGLKNAIYSGNHGLEIDGPRIKFKPVVSPRFRKIIEKIKDNLAAEASSFKGVLIEDKGISLSLHYRLAEKKDIPKIKTIFHEAVIAPLVENKIKIKFGKRVLEVMPPVDWDKGKIVLWLLARQVFASKDIPVLPIYIGDDVTDEDAFKALNKRGLTILVGKPKESCAQFYLKNPNEAMVFLKRLSAILSS